MMKAHCTIIMKKKKEVFSACKQELVEFHNVLIVLKVEDPENYETILCT